MLQDRDLHTYLELFRLASEAKHFPTPASLDEVLRSDNGSIHHLRREHLTPLWNSLKIAWAADGAPELAFHVIHRVVNELTDDASYVPFTSQDAWISAIRWALAAIEDSGSGAPSLQQSDRRSTVGLAVQRLRNCGYSIAIGAHGPILNTETKRAIAARIHSLISSLGGIQVARQICYYMRLKHKVHDGMWALGHRVSYSHPAEPAAPIAWLFSIAIRYFHVIPSSLNRASDWKTAVSLAVDFAACIDCQRYNQFEMLNLEPSDYVPTLMELLEWRELFWLPQVPPATLATLSTALSCVGWPEKPKDLRRTVQGLFCEMDHLLGVLADDNLTMIPTVDARARYPLLWSHARAAPGKANSRYMGPFDSEERCHDRFLMFETTEDSVVLLPRAMTTAAACEVVFRLIWATVPQDAHLIVGDTLEKCIAISCKGQADIIFTKEVYESDGECLEMDLAARSNQEIVLIETKAKSLTSTSRSGNVLSFLSDYAKSYLALTRQLVRHERNIRKGITPLTTSDDELDGIRVTMVAVSPLSYGPVSDNTFANALLRAMLHARLNPSTSDKKIVNILHKFNKIIGDIEGELFHGDRQESDQIDLIKYFMDLVWLDVGQLLYLVRRGLSLSQAFAALKHVTFSTGDFWTEVAALDDQGLSSRNWHPPENATSSNPKRLRD